MLMFSRTHVGVRRFRRLISEGLRSQRPGGSLLRCIINTQGYEDEGFNKKAGTSLPILCVLGFRWYKSTSFARKCSGVVD